MNSETNDFQLVKKSNSMIDLSKSTMINDTIMSLHDNTLVEDSHTYAHFNRQIEQLNIQLQSANQEIENLSFENNKLKKAIDRYKTLGFDDSPSSGTIMTRKQTRLANMKKCQDSQAVRKRKYSIEKEHGDNYLSQLGTPTNSPTTNKKPKNENESPITPTVINKNERLPTINKQKVKKTTNNKQKTILINNDTEYSTTNINIEPVTQVQRNNNSKEGKTTHNKQKITPINNDTEHSTTNINIAPDTQGQRNNNSKEGKTTHNKQKITLANTDTEHSTTNTNTESSTQVQRNNNSKAGKRFGKILILADEQGQHTQLTLQQLLGDNYKVKCYWKPGARLQDIIDATKNETDKFTKNDFIILLAGTNERIPYEFQSVLHVWLNSVSHTNILLPQILYGVHLREQKLNYELEHICNQYEHAMYVNMSYQYYRPRRHEFCVNICRSVLKEILHLSYKHNFLRYQTAQSNCKILKSDLPAIKYTTDSNVKLRKLYNVNSKVNKSTQTYDEPQIINDETVNSNDHLFRL